jgi:hypothetical protein
MENVIPELLKWMDGASVAVYKEMVRVIRSMLDTRDTCLKLKPNLIDKNWDLVVYSDSDWARDVENYISVNGFIISFLRVPICWRSKGKKGVTLSSSKVEYLAMLKAVKEIRFIFFFLTS